MINNTLKSLILSIALTGCANHKLTDHSAARMAPYLDPQHFSFYGMRFGDAPGQDMLSVTPADSMEDIEVYKLASDPIASKLSQYSNLSITYSYYHNRLFKIDGSFDGRDCSRLYGLAYNMKRYGLRLKGAYYGVQAYKIMGAGGTSVSAAEQEALEGLPELEESGIKWGYLYSLRSLVKDRRAIVENNFNNAAFVNSMMPGVNNTDFTLLKAQHSLISQTPEYRRLHQQTNGSASPVYFNKQTYVEFSCGDQASMSFLHRPTVDNNKRLSDERSINRTIDKQAKFYRTHQVQSN